MSPPPGRGTLKTYSHLMGARRIPSEYDVASAGLLYYVSRGFEVKTPVSPWYEQHQRHSALQADDWERFQDPRLTTYAGYVALQSRGEALIDGLLRSIDETGYDGALPDGALALLETVVGALRFPVHGLQMLAAYVGQMAPSGKITVAAALQAADEVRRLHRLAYRLGQLRRVRPGFGDTGRARWETDASLQPLRRLIERLWVAYDWGESFAGLNLCAKPLFDDAVLVHAAAALLARGDRVFSELAYALYEDSRWQRAWTAALVQTAVGARAENRDVLRRWTAAWLEPAREAATSLMATLGAGDEVPGLVEAHQAWLRTLELTP